MSAARLALRLVVGGIFVGHGMQKLAGWFGGPGLEGTDKMMEATDMRPARPNAIAAGATEAVGGALLAAGVATPIAAAGLIGVMVTAIRKVHAPKGLWNSNGGWEYNAVLIATLTALAADDSGALPGDEACGRRTGALRGLFAIAGGLIGSSVLIELGRRGGRDSDT